MRKKRIIGCAIVLVVCTVLVCVLLNGKTKQSPGEEPETATEEKMQAENHSKRMDDQAVSESATADGSAAEPDDFGGADRSAPKKSKPDTAAESSSDTYDVTPKADGTTQDKSGTIILPEDPVTPDTEKTAGEESLNSESELTQGTTTPEIVTDESGRIVLPEV